MEISVELVGEAVPQEAQVLQVCGVEGMNRQVDLEVRLLLPEEMELEPLLKQPVVLSLYDPLENVGRGIELMIVQAEYLGSDGEGWVYRLRLSTLHALFELSGGYAIYRDKTAPEIVSEALQAGGVASDKVEWRLSDSYAQRAHTAQYGELHWRFIERVLAEEGISYWFETSDDGTKLVFGDGSESHSDMAEGPLLTFDDSQGMVRRRSLSSFEVSRQLGVTHVALRDYDVRQPDLYIDGEAGEGPLSYFEYPANVPRAAADARAKVRLEQLQRFSIFAEGRGDCIRVAPGRVVKIEGASDEDLDGRYLVVEVEHDFSVRTAQGGDQGSYAHRVRFVPMDKPFRPAVPEPLAIGGIEPGVTTGPAGEEIHVNDLGDVKVRFPWDRSGIVDDTSSTWVRCVQMPLGGSQVLPRVGWEVPVMYVDGNPDRPVVLGRCYNAEMAVPYSLPDGKATTALQSATSPGDGSTNEIRMGDNAGSQEMFVHASRDQSVGVGGSSTCDVALNETHDVGLAYKISIDGSQSHTVSANQDVSVTGDYTTIIDGARVETVGGLEHTKVTANRLCDVSGLYAETVGGVYGLQANQTNVDVKGLYTQSVAGVTAHAAGMGISETVAGARALSVGGGQTVVCRAGYTDTTKIAGKKITAGASTVESGGPLATKCGQKMSVKVGGTASIESSKKVVVATKSIKVQITGALKAGAFELSGGTVKITKGVAKLDGTVKRKGGTELE